MIPETRKVPPRAPADASILEAITRAIIRQEGGNVQHSVNQELIRRYGRYNPGHLIWAEQYSAECCDLLQNGTLRHWAGWATEAAAIEGVRRDVAAKMQRLHTITDLISAYAPKTENLTTEYIANVSKWSGIGPDADLRTLKGAPASKPGWFRRLLSIFKRKG